MFEITRNSGFKMTFENGCTLSVQFHPCFNYITNRDFRWNNTNMKEGDIINASQNRQPDAEIAVFDEMRNFITREFYPDLMDDVKGWVTPDEVAELMVRVKNRHK